MVDRGRVQRGKGCGRGGAPLAPLKARRGGGVGHGKPRRGHGRDAGGVASAMRALALRMEGRGVLAARRRQLRRASRAR